MSNDNAKPLVLTIRECAKLLGKSYLFIWNLAKLDSNQPGSIPSVRVGKNVHFVPTEIDRWLALGCPPADQVIKERGTTN